MGVLCCLNVLKLYKCVLRRHPTREKCYGCFVQPVKMFRLSSAACQDVSSFVRHPVFSEYVCVCVCVCVFCVCVCVCVCVREGERERESFIQESEKLWCGSCAVWMFRPSSAVCQDVSSFVRYPVFSLFVCVRERETASYKREKSFGVGLVLSGCFVHRQQSVKMVRLSSGTPCLVCV